MRSSAGAAQELKPRPFRALPRSRRPSRSRPLRLRLPRRVWRCEVDRFILPGCRALPYCQALPGCRVAAWLLPGSGEVDPHR